MADQIVSLSLAIIINRFSSTVRASITILFGSSHNVFYSSKSIPCLVLLASLFSGSNPNIDFTYLANTINVAKSCKKCLIIKQKCAGIDTYLTLVDLLPNTKLTKNIRQQIICRHLPGNLPEVMQRPSDVHGEEVVGHLTVQSGEDIE